jgi:hypothetical protein
MADLLEVEASIALLRERFAAQAQAKLQRLSEDVEKGEQNLHALVCEFETRARDEADRVEREVAERSKAGTASSAEKDLSNELSNVLERLPARDIGPGWRI